MSHPVEVTSMIDIKVNAQTGEVEAIKIRQV
jgi:hypothetical protein